MSASRKQKRFEATQYELPLDFGKSVLGLKDRGNGKGRFVGVVKLGGIIKGVCGHLHGTRKAAERCMNRKLNEAIRLWTVRTGWN